MARRRWDSEDTRHTRHWNRGRSGPLWPGVLREPRRATEGFISVPGGRIWWARMGKGPGTPLIVIHGGPGSTSYGLKALRVPTLFVAGEFAEATPAPTERFSTLVPGAEFTIIPNSGHSTENDNPDGLLRTVREFLHRAEGSRT